jgi:hypothetical protein
MEATWRLLTSNTRLHTQEAQHTIAQLQKQTNKHAPREIKRIKKTTGTKKRKHIGP